MIVNNVELKAVTASKKQYPDDGKPEIALVGKSNVGKSTLINNMINRKALARTSKTPGKTRTINFYQVEELLYLVDLPGYGYAKAPDSEIQKWGTMMEEYLDKREELKGILLLIDSRHEPSKHDRMMFDWIKYFDYDVNIVLTKVDKLTRNQLAKNIAMIKKSLGLSKDDKLIPFSSLAKVGREELWELINESILK